MTLSDVERKASQRERTRKHREKVKERSANDALANEQKSKDQFDQWRVQERLVFPGEIEPFENVTTVKDAIISAREYLAAMSCQDVFSGEALIDVERRVVSAWNELGCPLLNRNSLRLEMSVASNDGFALDFDKWIPIPGAEEVIDITLLPVIEISTVCEVPAVDTPAINNRADDPALKNHRTPEVIAICKAQQDACDADARRISAKNLQRETEREQRLGVGYAYDA